MPALRELDAEFLKHHEDGHTRVETLAEADGIYFLCPKCFRQLGSRVGCHGVICWFTGKVPNGLYPGPGRWNPSGTGMDDLTFVPPGAFSVQLVGGCGWHGYVKNGSAD